jgi:hypothetical protein
VEREVGEDGGGQRQVGARDLEDALGSGVPGAQEIGERVAVGEVEGVGGGHGGTMGRGRRASGGRV